MYHSVARPKRNPGVNQLPLFTGECESSQAERGGCGRNPDGCAWCLAVTFTNLRIGKMAEKSLSCCEMAQNWAEA